MIPAIFETLLLVVLLCLKHSSGLDTTGKPVPNCACLTTIRSRWARKANRVSCWAMMSLATEESAGEITISCFRCPLFVCRKRRRIGGPGSMIPYCLKLKRPIQAGIALSHSCAECAHCHTVQCSSTHRGKAQKNSTAKNLECHCPGTCSRPNMKNTKAQENVTSRGLNKDLLKTRYSMRSHTGSRQEFHSSRFYSRVNLQYCCPLSLVRSYKQARVP